MEAFRRIIYKIMTDDRKTVKTLFMKPPNRFMIHLLLWFWIDPNEEVAKQCNATNDDDNVQLVLVQVRDEQGRIMFLNILGVKGQE